MELSLSFYGRPNISDVHVRKILWKYLWIPIFQTKNPFFCYLGVFPQKVHFLKKNSFCERIFLRPLLTCGNTPNKFFDFFHTFFLVFFSKKNSSYSWGVKTALCKISWFFNENPPRNNSSKLNIFGPFFSKTHSAVGVF